MSKAKPTKNIFIAYICPDVYLEARIVIYYFNLTI